MALSYSVGDVFLGNGRQGSLEKSAETGGFDDVVITDKHFLDVLNVDSKYLKKNFSSRTASCCQEKAHIVQQNVVKA